MAIIRPSTVEDVEQIEYQYKCVGEDESGNLQSCHTPCKTQHNPMCVHCCNMTQSIHNNFFDLFTIMIFIVCFTDC